MTAPGPRYLWITLTDGCRLSARLWLPASDAPTPTVLEYHPYRMRDGTAERDECNHAYFAEHGYAALRVDIRGTGDSDGIMGDEYTEQELSDGLEVIAWVAAQSWCDGQVALFGLSWGGFNALQLAALRAPALKVIVTCGSTDDRFADDCHYRGGCLLTEHMGWASTMLSFFSMPPSLAAVGSKWQSMWLSRLSQQPFVLTDWLQHQRRDAFWKHGSVCETIKSIEVPVLMAGGWLDSYRNAIPRLLSSLSSPSVGIIGPWMHRFPHTGLPGPAVGFLQFCVKWFDRWLKGAEIDVPAAAEMLAYIMEPQSPDPTPTYREGCWLAIPRTARDDAGTRIFHLGVGVLQDLPGEAGFVTICSKQTTGMLGGELVPMGWGSEAPGDQRYDDADSLVFDTPVLEESLTLFGETRFETTLFSDQPVAHLIGRLCDVSPDGSSTRVTLGALNLTHKDGHEIPQALKPDTPYRVTLRFDHIAYRIPSGHRLRLALSTTYWPLIWPVPKPATLYFDIQASQLRIPLLPKTGTPVHWESPAMATPSKRQSLSAGANSRETRWDHVTGRLITSLVDDAAEQLHHDLGVVTGNRTERIYEISPADPLSARMSSKRDRLLVDEDGNRTRTEVRTSMYGDEVHFHVEARLRAYLDENLFFERAWRERIARDHA